MIAVCSNDVLFNANHFWINYVQVDVDRIINIIDIILEPNGLFTIAKSYNFAIEVFMQYDARKNTVNICIDDDVLVL